jgi:glutathione-specific gamma-glutamylcyclotransferase
MFADTAAPQQQPDAIQRPEQLWLFGYGSLIFKVDFPYLERCPASIRGWARRFWQASHDHRGTLQAPGRVATLVPQVDAVCDGVAYLVTPQVFGHLDHREKNGYLRIATGMQFDDGSQAEGVIYIAGADNPAYLGPASELSIARQIAAAVGPSGSNRDYLLQLAQALRALGTSDPHVFALERWLRQL